MHRVTERCGYVQALLVVEGKYVKLRAFRRYADFRVERRNRKADASRDGWVLLSADRVSGGVSLNGDGEAHAP